MAVEVNPVVGGQRLIIEANTLNNTMTHVAVVWKTAPLNVAFIKLNCDFRVGDRDFVRIANEGFEFARATLPVNPDVSKGIAHLGFYNNYLCNGVQSLDDLSSRIVLLGRKLSEFTAKRVVAIASPQMVRFARGTPELPRVSGFAPCDGGWAVVSDDAFANTVAHELGHTFGLSDEYSGGSSCGHRGTESTDGYWVDRGQSQIKKPAFCN
jgi:hypothetical protein